MTPVAFLRHGPTEWSAIHRIQGRTDMPLSAAGRAAVKTWRLPDELVDFEVIASPLARAAETARLLVGGEAALQPRLAEMDWGDWEGRQLAELRQELGEEMARNEARGLDFRPAGGESPREVQDRLRPWLAEVARAGRPALAVTHKGVIRAVLAAATGWDMTGKPPVKLDWAAAHLFAVDTDGQARIDRVNLGMLA